MRLLTVPIACACKGVNPDWQMLDMSHRRAEQGFCACWWEEPRIHWGPWLPVGWRDSRTTCNREHASIPISSFPL